MMFNPSRDEARNFLFETWRKRREGSLLTPLEDAVDPARRYTVVHAGKPRLIDPILASNSLAGACRDARIVNEGLEDEVFAQDPILGSLHAPIVVTLSL